MKKYDLDITTGLKLQVNPIGEKVCSEGKITHIMNKILGCPHIDFTSSVLDTEGHVWLKAEGRHYVSQEAQVTLLKK